MNATFIVDVNYNMATVRILYLINHWQAYDFCMVINNKLTLVMAHLHFVTVITW
jgi:hypothetical protein